MAHILIGLFNSGTEQTLLHAIPDEWYDTMKMLFSYMRGSESYIDTEDAVHYANKLCPKSLRSTLFLGLSRIATSRFHSSYPNWMFILAVGTYGIQPSDMRRVNLEDIEKMFLRLTTAIGVTLRSIDPSGFAVYGVVYSKKDIVEQTYCYLRDVWCFLWNRIKERTEYDAFTGTLPVNPCLSNRERFLLYHSLVQDLFLGTLNFLPKDVHLILRPFVDATQNLYTTTYAIRRYPIILRLDMTDIRCLQNQCMRIRTHWPDPKVSERINWIFTSLSELSHLSELYTLLVEPFVDEEWFRTPFVPISIK
jgi:hypothetical protein